MSQHEKELNVTKVWAKVEWSWERLAPSQPACDVNHESTIASSTQTVITFLPTRKVQQECDRYMCYTMPSILSIVISYCHLLRLFMNHVRIPFPPVSDVSISALHVRCSQSLRMVSECQHSLIHQRSRSSAFHLTNA